MNIFISSLPVPVALLHVAYPKDSRCSLQMQLRRIFRLLFYAPPRNFSAARKIRPKKLPVLSLQATFAYVQLCVASLKKFPEKNSEVLVDVILSNGLIDTGFALLVCCPAPLCLQRKVPAFYPPSPDSYPVAIYIII